MQHELSLLLSSWPRLSTLSASTWKATSQTQKGHDPLLSFFPRLALPSSRRYTGQSPNKSHWPFPCMSSLGLAPACLGRHAPFSFSIFSYLNLLPVPFETGFDFFPFSTCSCRDDGEWLCNTVLHQHHCAPPVLSQGLSVSRCAHLAIWRTVGSNVKAVEWSGRQ